MLTNCRINTLNIKPILNRNRDPMQRPNNLPRLLKILIQNLRLNKRPFEENLRKTFCHLLRDCSTFTKCRCELLAGYLSRCN